MTRSVIVAVVITARTAAAAPEGPTVRRPRCRGAGVQRDHFQHLDALATLPDLAMDRRSFWCILKSRFFQRGDVQEHIRRAVRRRNKAKTLFRIEPFDSPPELGTTLLVIHCMCSIPCRSSGAFIIGPELFLLPIADAELPQVSMGVDPRKSKGPVGPVNRTRARRRQREQWPIHGGSVIDIQHIPTGCDETQRSEQLLVGFCVPRWNSRIAAIMAAGRWTRKRDTD